MRASDTSEVLFDNCRIPADRLVGVEGQGFVNTMQVLDAGRIGIAALAVGLAQGAYEAALRYARERKSFGKPIAGFQAIQWKLADAATKIEAARLLTYQAAYLKGRGQRTTLESSMAKLYASEIAVKVADDCVQIHGGYGFVKDYPAEKYFRDVKLTTIGEGTSEIQRLVIARQLCRDERGRHLQRRQRRACRPARGCECSRCCVDRCRVTATLAARLLAGDPRAIARAISLIEDEDPSAADLVGAIFSHTGRAYLIGVTGPPGAGKSTLVDRLITNLRQPQRPQSTQSEEPKSLCGLGDLRGSFCVVLGRRDRRRSDQPVHRRRGARRSAADADALVGSPACSSAAWRRAAISAVWRAPPATPRSCSTPPARTS